MLGLGWEWGEARVPANELSSKAPPGQQLQLNLRHCPEAFQSHPVAREAAVPQRDYSTARQEDAEGARQEDAEGASHG